MISRVDGVSSRSSIIGYTRYWKHNGTSPRSRAEQGGAGGEPATRTCPADRHSSRVDAELTEVSGEPLQPRVTIVDMRGVLVLGCEPVVDRRDDAAEVARPRLAHEVIAVDRAEDHSAAMDPQKGRGVGAAVGAGVHPDSNFRAVGARREVVGDLDLRDAPEGGAQRRFEPLDEHAQLWDVSTEVDLGSGFECDGQLRVELLEERHGRNVVRALIRAG